MILSGLKIAEEVKAGRIYISDFDEKRLNPNSYNLRLADEILTYEPTPFDNDDVLDMERANSYMIDKIPGKRPCHAPRQALPRPHDGADAH